MHIIIIIQRLHRLINLYQSLNSSSMHHLRSFYERYNESCFVSALVFINRICMRHTYSKNKIWYYVIFYSDLK